MLVFAVIHGGFMAWLMGHSVRTGRANRLDGRIDIKDTGLFERQRQLDQIAFLQWGLQVHQHHMIAVRLQQDRLAGLDCYRVNAAHAHHVAVFDVGVQFDTACDRGRDRDQAVRHACCRFDFQIGRAIADAAGCCAGPGMGDGDASIGCFVSSCSKRYRQSGKKDGNCWQGAH